jgi:hypothetical protein
MEEAMLYAPTADHHEGLFGLVAQSWRAWKERRDSLAALDSVGRGEVARIAHDLSLTPTELRKLAAQGPDSADLVYERMADLGLGRELIAGSDRRTMWELEKTCALCTSKSRCRHDFARGAATSAWREYCPNDDTLTALARAGTRPGAGAAARAARLDHDRRSLYGSLVGLMLVSLAWMILLLPPPAGLLHNQGAAVFAPSASLAAPSSVTCLDASCLTAEQQTALLDLRGVQSKGWLATSAAEMAALPRTTRMVQDIRAGEANACRLAGGASYYGLPYQQGCNPAGRKAARLEGYNECRPMAGGGVCMLK